MKRIISALFITLALTSYSHAAILVMSPNGTYTTKATLSAAVTAADTVGKTIVVTSALSAVQSNISSATVTSWPTDRALIVKKGGSINPTTKFTGLHYAEPEWFGASTALANNQPAIQKAIEAVKDNAGTVLISAGNFFITDPIELYSGMTFKGVSKRSSNIYQTDSSKNAINITGIAGAPKVQITISDLKVTGAGKSTGGAGVGIYCVYGAVGVNLKDLWVVAHGSHGIQYENTYSSNIESVFLDNNGGDGFHAETSANHLTFIDTISISNGGAGYAIIGGSAIGMYNADAESNNKAGIDLRYVNGAIISAAELEKNGADGTSPNLYIGWKSSAADTCNAVTIQGGINQGTAVAKYGITVDGANLTIIDGVYFATNITGNINITANATRTVIGTNSHIGATTKVIDASATTALFGYDQVKLGISLGKGVILEAGAFTGSASDGAFYRSSGFNGNIRFKTTDTITRTMLMALEGSGTLSFGSIAANTTAEISLTVTGAIVGDAVIVYTSAPLPGLMYMAYVSATDTVTIRMANVTVGAIDPADNSFRVRVIRSQL